MKILSRSVCFVCASAALVFFLLPGWGADPAQGNSREQSHTSTHSAAYSIPDDLNAKHPTVVQGGIIRPMNYEPAPEITIGTFLVQGKSYQNEISSPLVTLAVQVEHHPELDGALLQYQVVQVGGFQTNAESFLAGQPWHDFRYEGDVFPIMPIEFEFDSAPGEKWIAFRVRGRYYDENGGQAWSMSFPVLDTVYLTGADDQPGLRSYVVPSGEVYRFALENGFRFETYLNGLGDELLPDPDGRCQFFLDEDTGRLVVSAEGGAPPKWMVLLPGALPLGDYSADCEFLLFLGKNLDQDWNIELVGVVPSASRYPVIQGGFGFEPPIACPDTYWMSIDDELPMNIAYYTVDGDCPEHNYALMNFVLTGPAEYHWHRAFQY